MSDYPGIGVMIQQLCGDRESVAAFTAALGKTITAIALTDDRLHLEFSDQTAIDFVDDGQSCCECRYLYSDDNLSASIGGTLLSAELVNAPPKEDDDTHEVRFLHVKTSKGVFTVEAHNEHNGYYGGFAVRVHESTVHS